MSRKQLRRKYMEFDTLIDSHTVLPLTLEEALDDWSLDPSYPESRNTKYKKYLRPLVAPPPTPVDVKPFFEREYASQERSRQESFSTEGSSPGMVEDHSGISDSDADPSAGDEQSQESMDRLWSLCEGPMKVTKDEISILYSRNRTPNIKRPSQSNVISEGVALQNMAPSDSEASLKLMRYPHGGKLTLLPSPPDVTRPPKLHRSPAQRVSHHPPNISKSLPPAPPSSPKRTYQLPTSQAPYPKRPRSKPPNRPLPQRPHPAPLDLNSPAGPAHPYPAHKHPATSPSDPAQPVSFNPTPPLPLPISPTEKSVFEYDSDDEKRRRGIRCRGSGGMSGVGGGSRPRASSLKARLHFRSLSLGMKKRDEGGAGASAGAGAGAGTGSGAGVGGVGLSGDKGKGKGRRRSATEVVMGVFGRRK